MDTTIVAVTIYSDQAVVTRRGSIHLGAGRHALEFAPLPRTLQTNSVTLTSQDPSLVLLDVAVQPQPHALANAQFALLLSELQALEAAYQRAKDDLARLYVRRDFLQELAQRSPRAFAVGLAQRQIGPEDAEALLTFLDQSYGELLGAIAQAESQKQALDRQLQAARQHLEQFRKASALPDYQVSASVETAASGLYEFELSYRVGSARWQMRYQARLATRDQILRMTWQAEVQQTSGEDWRDVALTIYSGRFVDGPRDRAAGSPTTPDWVPRVSASERPRKLSRSPVLEDAYRMLGAVPGSEVPAIDETLPETAEPVAFPLPSLSFAPPGRFTVCHQASPTLIEINTAELTCDVFYLALPQSSSYGYVQASFSPVDGLLPGIVKLFRDSTYQGETQISICLPGQPLTLTFGSDTQVHSSHRLALHHRDKSAGSEALGYEILLTNQGNAARPCRVKVQIFANGQDQTQAAVTQTEPVVQPSKQGECC
ncbi:MAG TPA: mucoidy inhibitor MuiA family protein, partial [Trichocoleus sp.]